jgi:hypothetical protein
VLFGFGNRPKKEEEPEVPQVEEKQELTVEQHAAVIEHILIEIGLPAKDIRMNTQAGYGWSFRRGSAMIEIYLAQQEEIGYLQVLSPLLHLPKTATLPLYRRLLELNLQLTSACFGVHGDVIYMFSERPLEGLDAVEANDIITKIAGYADDYDNLLVEEFGGRLYMQA